MAERDLSSSNNPERAEILAKMEELDTLVVNYFLKFTKTTQGKSSIGDGSFDFVNTTAEKAELFPEVVPNTLDKADYKLKLAGVNDFFAFKQRIIKAIGKWDTSALVVKTDSMFYTNRIYNNFKVEAKNAVKYQPAYNELLPYYKKSGGDKNDETAKNGKAAKTEATTESDSK